MRTKFEPGRSLGRCLVDSAIARFSFLLSSNPLLSSAWNIQTKTFNMHLVYLWSILALFRLEIARAVDYFPPPTLSVNESRNECVPLSPSHLP